jgi:hypothetical protein
MALQHRPYFRPDSLRGIDDVQYTLEELDTALKEHYLAPLRSFNTVYLIITRNVRQKLGSFEDPAFLERFDTRFASYYLNALHAYLTDGVVPPAWRLAFDAALDKMASPFLGMALGVNAHVNNDIAQVLKDCGADDRHERDFYRVNRIIKDSLREATGSFNEGRFYGPHRALLKPAYHAAMSTLIVRWRHKAWITFRKLESGRTNRPAVEASALRTGTMIRRLPL